MTRSNWTYLVPTLFREVGTAQPIATGCEYGNPIHRSNLFSTKTLERSIDQYIEVGSAFLVGRLDRDQEANCPC